MAIVMTASRFTLKKKKGGAQSQLYLPTLIAFSHFKLLLLSN